jgi:small-conductance mechanosensitive channel
MAAIRLVVYALRYIIEPGGMLKTLENTIAGAIWILLALHLIGILPEILSALEAIEFKIGKNPVNLLLALQGVLTILITIFIALWCSRIFENRLLRVNNINMNLRVVLAKLLRVMLLFIAILIALSAVGLDITMLSVFGGALGVGLGFGLQRIASNYVSGFIILLDKSMQIGDVVTIDIHYGVVSELRTRYLVLRKLDGTEVIIPNETMITNPVINHSFTDHKARVQMPIQVSYDSELELAMQVMREAAERHPRVLVEPAPAVQIRGFGESGIDLMLIVWIPDPEEGSAALQSEIYLEIWQAFKQNKISIPFPQREVRILNLNAENLNTEPS